MHRRDFLSFGLALGGALALPSPASLTSAATITDNRRKKVYAHWHWFPTSFDNLPPDVDIYAQHLSPNGANGKFRAEGGYVRERPLPRPPRPEPDWAMRDLADEIRLARAIGLDGFHFNIASVDPASIYMQTLYNMLGAAQAEPPGFEISLSLDLSVLKDVSDDPLVFAILDLGKRPGVARHSDGRLILGAFAAELWGARRWKSFLEKLAGSGAAVSFNPTFLDIRRLNQYVALIDGASMWGVHKPSEIELLRRTARRVKRAGKTWSSSVWPQDFRPKDRWFAESGNSELFRESWRAAIETDADAIIVCTWNDYSEGSEIRPSTGIQYAFYDLAAFYIAWYKRGKMPEIIEDNLFFFHRIEATDAPGTGSAQPFRFTTHPSNSLADPARNDIELLAFLRQPGEIQIITASGTSRLEAKSGMTSFRAPLAPGKVSFRLERGGRQILAVDSPFQVRETSSYQNLLYHAGSSARPPL